MKKMLILLAFLPIAAHAQIRGTVLNDLMKKSNVSVLEASAAMFIAQAVGLDPMAVVRETRPYGVSVYDTAPAWYIVHESHRSFGDVWKERKKGKGWGVIAHEMGMHPGTFNKMRKDGDFDHYCWVSWSKKYGYTDSDWSRYQSHGVGDRDFLIASVLSNGDHKHTESVYHERQSSGYWDVPGHGKVKGNEAWGKGHGSANSTHGNSQGKGKSVDKGQGKSNGKGNGSGKGNGGGNDDGNGKGNGNGGSAHGNSNGGGHGQANTHGKGKGNGNGHGKGKGL